MYLAIHLCCFFPTFFVFCLLLLLLFLLLLLLFFFFFGVVLLSLFLFFAFCLSRKLIFFLFCLGWRGRRELRRWAYPARLFLWRYVRCFVTFLLQPPCVGPSSFLLALFPINLRQKITVKDNVLVSHPNAIYVANSVISQHVLYFE